MALLLGSEISLFLFLVVPAFSIQPTQLTLDLLYDKVKSLIKDSDFSTLMEIGKSVENRSIYAVKIQKGVKQDSTVVVEFGIHARELASPASGLYLLEKFLKNPACEGLLKRIRWYIIPVLNPDGYKYVVDTGELWRKNRAHIDSSSCIGVDLNRNFPVGWENLTDSAYYCQETYCGPAPISEPESIALKKFLDGVIQKYKVKAYIAVHTCAAGVFYPYGYAPKKAANHDELEKVGELMTNSIRKVAGMDYKVGPAYLLGIGGGGVDEWVYDTYQVPLVYTFELDGSRLTSQQCFFPPTNVTKRLERECFAGVVSLASYISPDALTEEDRIRCYNDSEYDGSGSRLSPATTLPLITIVNLSSFSCSANSYLLLMVVRSPIFFK